MPEGASVALNVRAGQARTMQNINVYPVQEPPTEAAARMIPSQKLAPFAFNRNFYSLDKPYLSQLVTVSPPMKLRNMTVVEVEMAAMQYNGARKLLAIYPDIEVELTFSKPFAAQQTPQALPSKTGATAQLPSAKLSLSQSSLKRLYRADFDKLVVNWDVIHDIVAHMKWDYLIITPDVFFNDIQPLAAWKQTKGLNVKVAKLSETGSSVGQIYNYIKQAYDNHAVDYVLLVGDTNTLPAYIYTASGGTASDYYYALVSGSDLLPDLAVGRFSGRTNAEIATLVAKTVRYEQTPSAGAWKREAICISDSGYFEQTSNYNYSNLAAHGFAVDRFYATYGNATSTNVASAVNNGRLLISYRGHGSRTGWSTTGFSNAHVAGLTNGNFLPIIISPTCLTGYYDDTPDCYSEAWSKYGTNTVHKGAVAYWGSGISYGGYNDELSKGAFDDMLAGDRIMGNVVNTAKLNMLSHYGTADSYARLELYMFNLFGDPNLNINF